MSTGRLENLKHLKKSKNSAYLALLADPVVDDAFAAEKLLDRMIDQQKDYLGYLN